MKSPRIRTVEKRIDSKARLIAAPLPYCDATDLEIDLGSHLSAPLAALSARDTVTQGDLIGALGPLVASFAGGKFSALLPRLLASSTLIVDGEGKYELGSVDGINSAFTGRNSYAIAAIRQAMEVNYADFFDAARRALAAIGLSFDPSAMMATLSGSATSSPSTSGTGSDTASG